MTHAGFRQWNPGKTFEPDRVHRFGHKAMHTLFEIWVDHEDATYASQAAHEAFTVLDALEQQFSRFIPNSDISRLNQAAVGQSVILGEETFRCLQLSLDMNGETGGLFDISLGSGSNALKLDPSTQTGTKTDSRLTLDLGGIGKGFAVDVMKEVLVDWEIESAFIHGGASSVYALGSTRQNSGWPITLSDPWHKDIPKDSYELADRAMGSSGLGKGPHIVNPHSGKPVREARAVWTCGPDATSTDALSTAFMMMDLDQIEAYCQHNPDIQGLVLIKEKNETTTRHAFGHWRV